MNSQTRFPRVAAQDQSYWRVSFGALALIILSYGSQFLAHFQHLPLWLLLFMPVVALYTYLVHKEYFFQPSLALKRSFTLALVLVFFAYYRTSFSIEMAVAFLLLSTGLKLLELRQKRDCYLFIFANLYLMATALLFSQGFFTAVYQLLSVIVAMLALLLLQTNWYQLKQMSLFASLSGWLVVVIPVVLVLFLFFPRVAPLWSIPIKTGGASTGISDSMSPGDISELSNSSERALRVTFDGELPPREHWYWRGVTLDLFDGRRWEASEVFPYVRGQKVDTGRILETTASSYRILLEPTQQRWAFALEHSKVQSSNVYLNDNGMVRFTNDAIQPTTYQLAMQGHLAPQRISPNYPIYPLTNEVEMPVTRKDLQVPFSGNPRTQAFVEQLRRKYNSDLQIMQAVLDLFATGPYFYTLKPPTTGKNFVDEFMFDTQRGFCAHYAGSLAYMLRLAGIPARVVVGYMGGEHIADQDYVLVHQYDAHGWVEANLNDYGWVRVDPTAMVAPERILNGLEAAMQEEGSFLEGSPLANAARAFTPLNWLRLELEKMNYQWQKWVVGFDKSAQQGLFEGLFNGYSLRKVSYVLALSLGAISVLVFVFMLREPSRNRASEALRSYNKWASKMARAGWIRRKGETPRSFLRRLKQDADIDYERARRVTHAFEQLEYQEQSTNAAAHLRRTLRKQL